MISDLTLVWLIYNSLDSRKEYSIFTSKAEGMRFVDTYSGTLIPVYISRKTILEISSQKHSWSDFAYFRVRGESIQVLGKHTRSVRCLEDSRVEVHKAPVSLPPTGWRQLSKTIGHQYSGSLTIEDLKATLSDLFNKST